MPHVTIVDMYDDVFRISVMVDRCHILLDERHTRWLSPVVPLLEYVLLRLMQRPC